MAMMTTGNPADVANRLQTHFSRKLLPHVQNTLRLAEFGQQAELPKNAGSKTIRFFRKREAKTDDIVTLTEGVAPTTFTEVTMEYVDATLVQYGEVTKISDVLEWLDIFNTLKEATETMGEDAGLHLDTVTRNAIIAGYQNIDNRHERFAGVTNTLDSSADFATFHALTNANGKVTRSIALGCVTQLKVSKAPKINGEYVCVIPPQLTHDLRKDTDWLEAAKYSSVKHLYKDEIGSLDGVRYVEATNPFIEGSTYGTFSAAGPNFTAMFLGKGMFGVPKLAGTSSPRAPKIIVTRGNDKADPLDQFCLAGWKTFWTAKVLNQSFGVLLRAKTTFA